MININPSAKNPSDTVIVKKRSLHIPKASEIVAANIRKKIIRGDLQEGDFLQPEGKLMEEFGVSRPTIREAFRILETERLVSVSRGARGGAVIHEPDADLIAEYFLLVLQAERTTIDEIYLARNFFEPSAVRFVARRSTASECALLRKWLAEEYAALDDAKSFGAAVAGFHMTLIELSQNRPLIHLVRAVNEVMERHQAMVLTQRRSEWQLAAAREVAKKGLKSHERLIELIEQRDADGAATHWREHMDATYKTWAIGFEKVTILELFPD